MAAKGKKSGTSHPELQFKGGPLDGTTMMMAEPLKDYYLLDMARSLYVRKEGLIYQFSTDWSIVDNEKKLII